jgi:hypothetical protein
VRIERVGSPDTPVTIDTTVRRLNPEVRYRMNPV